MLRTLGILITVQAVSLLIPSDNDCHRLLLAVQVVVAIYLLCSIVTEEVVDMDEDPAGSPNALSGNRDVPAAGAPMTPGLMNQYAVLQFIEQVEEREQARCESDQQQILW